MNPEVKQLWLAALRSGEYTQGRNALAKYDYEVGEMTFCCLGVLCEVARRSGVDVQSDDLLTEDHEHFNLYNGDMELPPPIVVAWAGLEDRCATYTWEYGGVAGTTTLAEQNDKGASFIRIANTIEKYF